MPADPTYPPVALERGAVGPTGGPIDVVGNRTGGIRQVIASVTPNNSPWVAGTAFDPAQLVDCRPPSGGSHATHRRQVRLVIEPPRTA